MAGAEPAAGRSSSHRWWAALAVITAAGLVVRVTYVLVVAARIEPGADATWYLLQAGIIGSGDGYLDPEAYFGRGEAVATANFPPLWPSLLAVVERVGLGGEQAYRLVGALVGTVTVAIAGLIGRRVAGDRVGLVAAGIVACSPLLIASDGSLMSESLFTALVTAAVLVAYRAIDEPGVGSMMVLGAVGGLAALTRSDALLIVLLLVGAVVVSVRDVPVRRRLLLGGVGLVAVVVLVAPWSVRNAVRLDSPVPSTNTGSVLEGANCPATYGGALLGAWKAECLIETRRANLSEAEWSAAGRARGIDHATDHPGRLPVVAAARLARTFGLWDPVPAARLEVVESRSERWQLAGWFYGLVTLAVAIPGFVLLVRRRAQVAPLLATVLGVAVVAVVSWGNQRFRLAAEPAVAVAAAAATVIWAGALRRRRRLQPRPAG